MNSKTRMNRKTVSRLAAAIALSAATYYGHADDFSQALDKINKIKPNIDYNSFCKTAPSGDDKIACQLNSIPTVALLVCKQDDYDGKSCHDVIQEEITNLSNVQKAKLKTVDFKTTLIEPLRCAEQKSTNCAGYLVSWVSNGTFVNIDDTIEANKIPELANTIKIYTPADKLSATIANLKAIASFMTPGVGKYSRICDLQGFYLRDGGFLINDVPSLEVNVGTAPNCWAGMPTYQQALDGINSLITQLK